jgi:hypothetical protein
VPRKYLFCVLLLAGPAMGQTTYPAATCGLTDVQTAINNEIAAAVDGDIISIPSGTCTWTGTTEVAGTFVKSVTIQGAGAISATTGGASTTGSDNTVIIDHITHSGGPPEALHIITTAGKTFRLTAISIQEDGSSTAANNAVVEIGGASTSVRVDHSHFHMFLSTSDLRFDGTYGVVDHNYFSGVGGTTGFEAGGIQFHSASLGDQAWVDPDQWGTSNFMFLEDCFFSLHSLGDSHDGSRYVYRYNTVQSSDLSAPQMANHGLDNNRGRSHRALEVYQNTITETHTSGVNQPTWSVNGGTLLYWGNTVSGYREAIGIDYTRKNNNTYNFGTPPSGWGNCSTSGGDGWDQNAAAPSGYACMDQPGRGAGDLISGSFPNICNITLNPACNVFTGQWPRQALSPIYVWNNSFTPASGYSPHSLISEQSGLASDNTDYYQQFGTNAEPGSFNGTVGVGQGTLVPTNASAYTNAPNCTAGPGGNTPGVGYWDTTNQTLYVCNPTNTWTVYYTPYTYPHPLTQTSTPTTAPATVMFVGVIKQASGSAKIQ